jgi:hypothetical protein
VTCCVRDRAPVPVIRQTESNADLTHAWASRSIGKRMTTHDDGTELAGEGFQLGSWHGVHVAFHFGRAVTCRGREQASSLRRARVESADRTSCQTPLRRSRAQARPSRSVEDGAGG